MQTTAGNPHLSASGINSGLVERGGCASIDLTTRADYSQPTHLLINPANWLSVGLAVCVLFALIIGRNAHGAIPEGFDPVSLYGSTAPYAIYRNQKRIGSHTISFTKTDQNTLEVSINSKLKVTLLGIPVYRFNYSAREKWQGVKLHSVTATTTEKGVSRTVSMQQQGSDMRLTNADGEVSIETLEHSSNHWNPAVLQSLLVFNTLSGKANRVSISKVGRDVLQIDNLPTPATHYQYTGELNVDVWYDDQQRWVKLAFKADDGSAIVYLSEGFTTE